MIAERMAGADAAWLHMDRATNRMIINCVVWFDDPLDWDAVVRAVRERLVARYRRFRQRVVVPAAQVGGLAGPRWVDVPDISVDEHLLRARLEQPGDAEALHRYIAAQVPRPLDPDRPLWELHLLDGYGAGSAMLFRLSHAIADGIALSHVLLSLSDEGPTADDPAWTRLAGDKGADVRPAGRSLGRVGAAFAHSLGRAVTNPATVRELTAFAGARAASLRKLALPRRDEDSVLHGPLGMAKSVTWTEPVPLSALKDVARTTRCSVNDVLLAVIAGALRRYLLDRDSAVETVGALVPFNVRPLDQPMPAHLGNRFGLAFPSLPVGVAEPRQRLRAVAEEMDLVKRARQGSVTFGWVSGVGFTPRWLENVLIDRYAGMASVIVTNVAGPARRVSLGGRSAAGLLLWVPMSGPIGLGLSIMSYAGQVIIGLMADNQRVPDLGPLRQALEAELAEVGELADVH